MVIFYYVQLIAVAFITVLGAFGYAGRMLLFLDTPSHQAAAVENLLWQTLRGVIAFGTTLGVMIWCKGSCKRRLCVVQNRRVSRKCKRKTKNNVAMPILFIALLLDGNIVNAVSNFDGENVETVWHTTSGVQDEMSGMGHYWHRQGQQLRLHEQGPHHNHRNHSIGDGIGPLQEAGREWLYGNPAWLSLLDETLRLEGITECQEEGQVTYIKTWYTDHSNRQRFEPRIVRLTEQDRQWELRMNIVEAWRDVIPWFVHVEFAVVYPRPPRRSTDTVTTEHVILSTNWAGSQYNVAGIVSLAQNGDLLGQCVTTVPEESSLQDVIETSCVRTDDAMLLRSIEGRVVTDELQRHRHGTSWTFIVEQPDGWTDVASFGQVTLTTHYIRSCKQNADIILDFDDDIPHDLYYRRDGARVAGRVIPPPGWENHYTLTSASYNHDAKRT